MKNFITTLFLVISSSCFGQYGYQNGLIITNDNDTIHCQVPITTVFGKKFIIKMDKEGNEKSVNVSDVKYLANSYTVYERINFVKKKKEEQKLMHFVAEGKINLYLEIITNKGPSSSGYGGTYAHFTTPTTTFVIRKDNQTFYIPKKNFSEHIVPLLDDAPNIASKIGNENYKYEDLEAIIKEYNQLFK